MAHPTKPSRYLLIPAMPAPNGPLHLGHISGPYLRLDIASRNLLRSGADVKVICGTDSYESFVELLARSEGVDAEEFASVNHRTIASDLNALDIALDAFIDPTGPEFRDRYQDAHDTLLDRLRSAGAVEARDKPLPFHDASNEFVLGSDLIGSCPSCRSEMSGFFCEECGLMIEPGEVRSPSSRAIAEAVLHRPHADLFARMPRANELLADLHARQVPANYVDICRRYLERSDGWQRLSLPPNGRMQRVPAGLDGARSLHGHGLLLAYCWLCGEVYRELDTTGLNPFDEGSDVVLVNGFGVDNSISHFIGIQGLAKACPGLRGFDSFVLNHFLLLDGEKFSTSRRHAIWARELLEDGRVDSDAIRWHLARISPETQGVDFRLAEFRHFHEKEVLGLLEPLSGAALCKPLDLSSRGPAALQGELQGLLRRQQELLEWSSFELPAAAHCIDLWLERGKDLVHQPSFGWWSLGLGVLAAPILPRLSAKLLSSHHNHRQKSLSDITRDLLLPSDTFQHDRN